jgi:hypothetical protein
MGKASLLGSPWLSSFSRSTAVLRMTSNGSTVIYTAGGPPNAHSSIEMSGATHTGYTTDITGLSVDDKNQLYITASTGGRDEGGYLLRRYANGSNYAPWADRPAGRTWTIDLNRGAPDLFLVSTILALALRRMKPAAALV